MQYFLVSDTEEHKITDKPLNLKDVTFILENKTGKETALNIQTFEEANQLIILNGFALCPNSKYELLDEDVVTIGNMAYRVRVMNTSSPAKRFKADTTKKITSFFSSTSNSSSKQTNSTPFATISGTWEEFNDHMVFTPEELRTSTKIAAFDMDGTLIKPKSGKKYPENTNDWMILSNHVQSKLLECYNDNFKLVIFSNQSPLGADATKRRDFKQKIENVLNAIKLPMQVFLATQKNDKRKPCIGMWEAMSARNDDKIDKSECFYIGDAAGRPKNGSTPKDHSFADLFFAKNVGIKFQTPEEFFMKAKPINIKIPYEPHVTCSQTKFGFSDKPEVIIMVGSPASGKSSFCKKNLIPKGYVHVNRDTLGSWQRCIQVLKDSLGSNKSVVVDNTNKDKESRKRFIDSARQMKASCRCFYMKVDKVRAMHNNKYRELMKENHATVTDIIIHSHYKGFQEPTLDEGFDEIVELACVPEFSLSEFKNKQVYEMYLLEKP